MTLTTWAQNHDKTILEQLNSGVRSIDRTCSLTLRKVLLLALRRVYFW